MTANTARNGIRRFHATLLVSAAAVAAGALIQSAASAQSAAQPSSTSQSATASSSKSAASPVQGAATGLEDIVVTAQRRTQAISQVPISVQAVTPTQIARLGTVDTTALTQLSPSVTFRAGYSANTTSFAIRGVTSIAIEGGIQPSTAIVIDGVPVYRQGEMVADLNDLQSIEILRGPQGTLFGKNSSAGVISINSNTPTKDFSGSVQGGLTNDKEYFGSAVLNVPVSDRIQTRFTGYYRDQNPLVDNKGIGNNLLGAKSYGFSGKVKVEINDDIDLLLSGSYAHRTSSYGQYFSIEGQSNPIQEGAEEAVTGIVPYRGNVQQNINSLVLERNKVAAFSAQLDWRISDRTTLTSITAYRKFKSDNTNDVDGTPAGADLGKPYTPQSAAYPFIESVRGTINGRQPDNTGYGSEELRLHYEGDRADLVTGLFYQTVKSDQDVNTGLVGLFLAQFGIFNPYYNNNFVNSTLKNDSAAGFADLTYKLSSKFTVFGGVRYTHETLSNNYSRTSILVTADRYDPITGNINTTAPLVPPFESVVNTHFFDSESVDNISGRAGVQFRPTEGQNYYASYNRGYKGPAAQVGRAATPDRALIPPEIATAFEIGTKQRMFDNRLSFSLSLYDQKIKNIQQSIVIPGTSNTELASAGNLKSKGAEFEVQALLARNFRLGGGVSYTDAKYSGKAGIVTCYAGETAAEGCINGAQSIDGKRAINAPKWRYNVDADYVIPIEGFGTVDADVNWNWSSAIQYGLDQNPKTVEPSHGFLNASVTLASHAGWEVQVYGRNLTNQFYYAALTASDGVIGQSVGYLARDYKRYGGVTFKYKF